jgi:transposase InsO family protein
VWSYDFISTVTADGDPLRILNVVDEYTRRALASHAARHIGVLDVTKTLEQLFRSHGKPEYLRWDDGREFIAATTREWLAARKVEAIFIEKGSPQQNAYVERFNGSMRDELLNGEHFDTVLEARVVIGRWRHEYNTLRPHRGLEYKTPEAFYQSSKVGSQ